jgi:hypothetical protein
MLPNLGNTSVENEKGLVEGVTMGFGPDGINWKNDPCYVPQIPT